MAERLLSDTTDSQDGCEAQTNAIDAAAKVVHKFVTDEFVRFMNGYLENLKHNVKNKEGNALIYEALELYKDSGADSALANFIRTDVHSLIATIPGCDSLLLEAVLRIYQNADDHLESTFQKCFVLKAIDLTLCNQKAGANKTIQILMYGKAITIREALFSCFRKAACAKSAHARSAGEVSPVQNIVPTASRMGRLRVRKSTPY